MRKGKYEAVSKKSYLIPITTLVFIITIAVLLQTTSLGSIVSTFQNNIENHISATIEKQVTNTRCSLDVLNTQYSGLYSGSVSRKCPDGYGSFSIEGSEASICGYFENGSITNSIEYAVTAWPVKIMFQNKELLGVYSGQLTERQFCGGFFEFSDNGNYLRYDGDINDLGILHKGNIDTNLFSISYDGKDYIGSYQGSILNGSASGKGVFKTVDSSKPSFHYDGKWTNGKFNGRGTLCYDSDSFPVYTGNFSNGSMKFDFADTIKTLSTVAPKFTLSDKRLEWAAWWQEYSDNSPNFTSSSEFKEYHNRCTDFSLVYSHFIKNPNKFETNDHLMYLGNYTVVQIAEADNLYGYKDPIFRIIANNHYGDDVCYFIGAGETEGIYEGTTINAWGFPLAYSSYESVANQTIHCIVMLLVGAELT